MAAAHNGDLAKRARLRPADRVLAGPTEYGPHQKRDFTAEQDWDVVATNIEDLASQLGV